MKKNLFLIVLFIFGINNIVYSNEIKCDQFKKFSGEYFKCKSNLIKDETISFGKNILKDTKEYQEKEWTDEKDKINQTKKKVLN